MRFAWLLALALAGCGGTQTQTSKARTPVPLEPPVAVEPGALVPTTLDPPPILITNATLLTADPARPRLEREDKPLTWPSWPLKLRMSSSHAEGCTREFAIATKGFSGPMGGGVASCAMAVAGTVNAATRARLLSNALALTGP